MGMTNEQRNQISLAGEFRVASELLLRGYQAILTLGNAKATDILLIKERSAYSIEVKTSKNRKNFVTSYFQKYADSKSLAPDFWVLFMPRIADDDQDIFFVMPHAIVEQAQLERNKGVKPSKGQGVDNLTVSFLEASYSQYKNNWKLLDQLGL